MSATHLHDTIVKFVRLAQTVDSEACILESEEWAKLTESVSMSNKYGIPSDAFCPIYGSLMLKEYLINEFNVYSYHVRYVIYSEEDDTFYVGVEYSYEVPKFLKKWHGKDVEFHVQYSGSTFYD